MSMFETLNSTRATLVALSNQFPEMQDKLLNLFCTWKYNSTLDELLAKNIKSTKATYVKQMNTHLMSNQSWESSFMCYVNINI